MDRGLDKSSLKVNRLMLRALTRCVFQRARFDAYNGMTSDTEGKIKRVSDEIRSWGAIAVVGSGASLRLGFPLTRQLQALLWHAMDSDPKLRDRLAASNGWSGSTAKEMIADDSMQS